MTVAENPICDICNEQPATVQFAEIGACDDCTQGNLRPGLSCALGYKPCGRILHLPDCTVICLVPYGVEHDHQA